MTDWPALLPDVARRLRGEPERIEAGGATWRYGAHGSLAVHVGGARRGTFRDFEADRSGGTLALVEHLAQCDHAGALRWLADAGLIAPPSNGAPRPPAPSPPPAPAPRPVTPSATADLARAILTAAVPADDTPARAYLAKRWTWPPNGTGPDLPAAVRWIPRADVPLQNGEHGPYNPLPATAAGAVVFKLVDPAGERPPAASLEAVTDAGDLVTPRWRRTYGSKAALVFEARSDPGGALVLTEGERDALALALTGAGGVVRAVLGTPGYRAEAAADVDARPVVLVPDVDHAGAAAVTKLLAADLDGRAVRLAPWPAPATGDPAAWLAGDISERAGIREYDGRMSRADADRAAWRALLAAVEAGWRLVDLEVDHE